MNRILVLLLGIALGAAGCMAFLIAEDVATMRWSNRR